MSSGARGSARLRTPAAAAAACLALLLAAGAPAAGAPAGLGLPAALAGLDLPAALAGLDLPAAPAARSVDDVAPALKNATASALTGAQDVLASYSDVLIAAAIPFGAVCTFVGYYMLGPVLFIAAFVVGGGASFVAARAALDDDETGAWASIVAMVIGGGFSGFAAVQMLAVGMFAVGASLGVATSTALRSVLWTKVFPKSPHAGYIFGCILLGILFGLVALALRKQMLILSTAYAGAFAMFFGIGHFAGHFPTLHELDRAEQGVFNPWVVLYLALTIFFGTVGMFVQFHLTRDKPMPARAPYSRRRERRRRVRSLSPRSTWSSGDADWERELLAASDRVRGFPVRSTVSSPGDRDGHSSTNEKSNPPTTDIEMGPEMPAGEVLGPAQAASLSTARENRDASIARENGRPPKVELPDSGAR